MKPLLLANRALSWCHLELFGALGIKTRVSISPFAVKHCPEHLLTNFFSHLGTLDVDLKANSGADRGVVYSASKFAQLLGAHYWRRELPGCTVLAVSPGLIPGTKLAGKDMGLTMDMPDAKTVPEGKMFRSK